MLWTPQLFVVITLSTIHCQTLEDLIKKIESPVPPKGQDFAPINGPKCLNSKIGIVGAGPSGVHMAYSLKKLGFTDVTILERSNRIGGKAEHFQYRGTKHPLSVLLWTNDYRHTLVPLLEEFGLLKDGSKGADGRASFWLTNDRSVPLLETTEYIASWIMKNLNVSDPNQAILRMIRDADEYTNIHKTLFGDYQFGLMRRPNPATWQYLSGTIFQFLQRNNLLSLVPLFQGIFHTTGYGTIYQLPAMYGLIWGTPRLLVDFLLGTEIKNLKKGTIDELFPKMVEKENIPVKFYFDVKKVWKKYNKIEIQSTKNERLSFDFLVWSGLPSDFEKVASYNLLGYFERHLFRSSSASHAATSIVDMDAMNRGHIVNIYVKNWDVLSFSNEVVISDDMFANREDLKRDDYLKGNFLYADGEPPNKKWTFAAFQYGNQTDFPPLQTLRNQLIEHYAGLDATNIEVLYTRTFDYFPRWNVQDAAQGYHWKMYDLQGKNNIWFIGGGLTFESVNNVMGYNQLLLSKMRPVLKNCYYYNPYNPFYYGRK